VFRQDNARPHPYIVSSESPEAPRALGSEVLMHPSRSPDLAPSDYRLFLSMASDFAGKQFGSREDRENRLSQWFASRDTSFYGKRYNEITRRMATKRCIFDLNWTVDLKPSI